MSYIKSKREIEAELEECKAEIQILQKQKSELLAQLNQFRVDEMQSRVDAFCWRRDMQIKADVNAAAERCAFWVGVYELERISQLPGARIEGDRLILQSKMNFDAVPNSTGKEAG